MRRAAVALPVMLSLTLLGLVAVAGAAVPPEQAKRLFESERRAAQTGSCARSTSQASRLMNALELKLALLCGRDEVLGRVAQEENEGARGEALGTDVRANDVGGESGSRTQHETTIARNEATGTLCTAFDHSYSGLVLNTDYTGFARSTDGGSSWSDRGTVHPASGQSFGSPTLVWRKSDGKFYAAALVQGGIGLWRSDDDCQSLTYVGFAHPAATTTRR